MKEINLTQGYVAIVDDEDFDEMAKFKWQVKVVGTLSGISRVYARAKHHEAKALRNLNRAVSAERELAELRRQHEAIPRVIRIVCRLLRGKS